MKATKHNNEHRKGACDNYGTTLFVNLVYQEEWRGLGSSQRAKWMERKKAVWEEFSISSWK